MPSINSNPQPPETPPSSSSSFSDNWKERILIPSVLAGIAGGGVGLVSKHRKTHGLVAISSSYAANLAIVTGCYCGAREFVRVARKSEPDDLVNSAVAGFGTGAILGRLQAGQFGATRYSIIFALAGTAVDYTRIRLRPTIRTYKESVLENKEKGGWWKWPEWSPIQVLDEEALAKKEAQERQLYEQRVLGKLNKEES